MATTIDNKHEPKSLEAELQDLALEENELDDRASSLELRTILVALLAGTALIFSVAALAVALIRTGGNSGSSNNAATPAVAAPTRAATASGPANMALPIKDINLRIKADAKAGSDGKRHDAFLPTTDLSAKAGQRVRVTIYNYDDMPHSFTSPGLAKGAAIPVAEQQMQGTPQDLKVMPAPGLGIDKMLPAGSDKQPSKTVLTFTVPARAGSYIWYCKVPCDAWAMAHYGYMIGRLKVTSA